MSAILAAQVRRRRLLQGLLLLAAVLLTWPRNLRADTSAPIRSVPAAGCYCHCVGSRARGGCTKMCELPKYASRWWATTCVKSRRVSPLPNHGASPRLPHPDRAEHARL